MKMLNKVNEKQGKVNENANTHYIYAFVWSSKIISLIQIRINEGNVHLQSTFDIANVL